MIKYKKTHKVFAKLMPGLGGVVEVAHEDVPPVGCHLAHTVPGILPCTV